MPAPRFVPRLFKPHILALPGFERRNAGSSRLAAIDVGKSMLTSAEKE